ncbi:MAG: DNA translocase FtsK [Candidatus Methylacidiphilales bacterium]|nr:DNA translocase FtsK [Candidatus Methylacidiphilales bacterium]
MAKAEVESRLVQEIAGIFLIGTGVLLFLALFSFDCGDLAFFKDPPNQPVLNYIGPVGAWVSAALVLAIGVASFLFPALMLVGGLALLFYHGSIDYRLKPVWFTLVVLSGSALLQIFQPLGMNFNGMEWPGGFIGHFINDVTLSAWLGRAGALITLLVVYFVALVLLFEIRPVELMKRTWEMILAWQKAREEAKLAEADPLERIAYEQAKLAREEKKLRRQLIKQGRPLEDLALAKPPADETGRPAPQVIDTSEPRPRSKTKPDSAPDPLPKPVERPEPAVVDTNAPGPVTVKPQEKKTPASSSSNPAVPASPQPTYESYQLPDNTLLSANDHAGHSPMSKADLEANRNLLVETILQFGIEVTPGDITRGATITRYEVYPAPGVRVERIAGLEKNIARAMKAEKVNILAPIPGKDSVGIEVANSSKAKIVLRDLFESDLWGSSKAKLPIALGKDVYGQVLVADLADMPHLLIAGTTGSGKSVCINCVLLSLLYRFSPDDLKIILVDPKVVELQVYNQLPHLVVPVVTEAKKVLIALRWVINEMEKRYQFMARAGVRNIAAYNNRPAPQKKPETLDLDQTLAQEGKGEALPMDELPGISPDPVNDMPTRMPFIVVIIDELADLMATSPADVELAIARLSAKARAAGIHLIIATQTPRAQVITGVIKTNVPCRIAFQVPSALDSRVILDENGAENLLGKGDLLYLPPGSSKLIRAQGAFVSDDEVAQVVDFIKKQSRPSYEAEIHQKLSKSAGADEVELSEEDADMVRKCFEVMRQEKRASTSMFQRRLRIGYNTAAWITDWMEQNGIVGGKDGAKDREILVDLDTFDLDRLL